MLAVAIFLPYFLIRIKYFKMFRFLLVVVISILIVFGSQFINQTYVTKDENWKTFYNYNQTRISLHDLPRLGNIGGETKYLSDIGWSKNDLSLFTQWFFPDPEVYSLRT